MSSTDSAILTQAADSADVSHRLQQLVRGRMPALDGLRGIAIISVVWHNGVWAGHWDTHGVLARLLNLSAGIGWVGVQLFFVLSGFLITGILLDEKGRPHQFRNFYVRRMLRIFPLYYGTLLLFFVVLPTLGVRPVLDIQESTRQVWYWFFLANWSIPTIGGPGALSHFWSLAVEEQFYLIWPFAVILLDRRKLAGLCIALVLSALAIRMFITAHGFAYAEWRAYEFTFARWDALAIGALMAIGVRNPSWQSLLRICARPVALTALAYIAIFILIEHNYAPVEHGIAVMNQTVVALLFAAILYLGLAPQSSWSAAWARLLVNDALRNVGKYSYAIYVFHYPLLIFFNLYLIDHISAFNANYPLLATPLRVLAISVVSYAMAVASWYLIEQPCLRLKRFFVTKSHAVTDAR